MLPTRLGGWIGLHATYVGPQAAVVVEQLRPNQLAELIVRLRGLTPRERDIVGCVARGLSTKAIGTALFISDYTVQDHLKAIFAKFGVASRAELVAAVFFDHYRPRHDRRDDPSPYGWFLDRPAAAT
jgi:DNA-binding NarL/FixJ family response regulator